MTGPERGRAPAETDTRALAYIGKGMFAEGDRFVSPWEVMERFDAAVRESDRLREAAEVALVRAANGFKEAYDYGCRWPIGIDTDPQEQRGMDRDTFIRNMEFCERLVNEALAAVLAVPTGATEEGK